MLYKLLEALLCWFQNTLHTCLSFFLFFPLSFVYDVYLDDGKLKTAVQKIKKCNNYIYFHVMLTLAFDRQKVKNSIFIMYIKYDI